MGHNTHNFLSFGPFFVFLPPNNPKNQNFENMRKKDDIIILHICTITMVPEI